MQTNHKENSRNDPLDPLIATEESLTSAHDTHFNRHDNSSNTQSFSQLLSQSPQPTTKYFPTIVHSMVTEADDSIIGWTNDGETFMVHDQSKLGPVLQKYFQRKSTLSFDVCVWLNRYLVLCLHEIGNELTMIGQIFFCLLFSYR